QFTEFKMKGLRPWLEQIANTLSNAENACLARVGPKLRENSFQISACASGPAHQSRKYRMQSASSGVRSWTKQTGAAPLIPDGFSVM
ncbi:MAG: hypothetical protein ACPF9G_12200, partial [Paracoccaceae bacterium]